MSPKVHNINIYNGIVIVLWYCMFQAFTPNWTETRGISPKIVILYISVQFFYHHFYHAKGEKEHLAYVLDVFVMQ